MGTFSVSKLVDIVEDSIGADDARVGAVCRVHAKDIFLNLHENSAKSPMWFVVFVSSSIINVHLAVERIP